MLLHPAPARWRVFVCLHVCMCLSVTDGNKHIEQTSKKEKLRNSKRCLTVGTWNLRTLVASMGEGVCRKDS